MCLDLDKIIADIENAFAGVRLNGGRTLEQVDALDNYELTEAELTVTPPPEELWQDVPEEELRRHPCAHPFLDAKGFRFYLPAYMRWVVRHFNDEQSLWNYSTIYSLMPDDEVYRARFALFNSEQSRCICRFLKYVNGKTDDFVEEIDAALQEYWGQFCWEE